MASPAKTTEIALAHQLVTLQSTVTGVVIDVSTAFEASVFLDAAPVQANANTNPPSWILRASAQNSGNDQWVVLQEIPLAFAGFPASEALTGIENPGNVTMQVASTAGFLPRDVFYIQNLATLAQSEWSEVRDITAGVSVNALDGLTFGKAAGDMLYGGAERNVVRIPCESLLRLRVDFVHQGAAGNTYHVRATLVREDAVA